MIHKGNKFSTEDILFYRRSEVLRVMGISNSEMYRRINAGLFVAPIAFGTRKKVWPAQEIRFLADAHLAGRTDEEIRSLVKQMKEERSHD